MPSHSERVRRNYHNVELTGRPDRARWEHVFELRITQMLIASAATTDQVLRLVWEEFERAVRRGGLNVK